MWNVRVAVIRPQGKGIGKAVAPGLAGAIANPERQRRFCHGIGFDKRYVILGNVGIGIAC
jgi:hypothetical protein